MDQFIQRCVSGGYATKSQALQYVNNKNKSFYSEDDIVDIYRLYDDWNVVNNKRIDLGDGCYCTKYDNWDEEY